MPEDIIRRSYFAVEVGFIDHDKWSGLTWAERGKWIAVRALAERQAVRGTFTNRALLERLLRKEGDRDAETTVSTLIEVKLLDLDDEGIVRVHDREEWLASSTLRVRRYRERLRNDAGVDNPVETVENVPERSRNGEERGETLHVTPVTNEMRGDERRIEPPSPSRGGSRANGTNPRAVAARKREAKKRERNAIHLAYLAGKLTEAEEAEAYRRLDSDRPQA